MSLPQFDMHFATPIFFLLLPAILLLGLWLIRHPRKKATIHYSSLELVKDCGGSWRTRFSRYLPTLRLLAAILIILSLARPQFGWRERQIDSYGVDIVLALDVSNSMQANDFSPTRLEVAKRVVTEFVDKRNTDRIGVVIFGDAPFTLVPLTLDYDAIKNFVSRLTIERIGEQNTALGKGLATAVKRLEDSEARSRIVVLLTDGVDTIGGIAPLDAAQAAKALGIKVYTIGIGSNDVASIPSFFGGVFARQRQMQFDEDLLKQIASDTGGKYYYAQDEEQLRLVYDEINRLEKSRIEATDFLHYEEKMALMAAPALLLLLLELLLGNTMFLKIP